jgi:hypothetical protein
VTAPITSVPTVEFYPPRLTPSHNGLFGAIEQGDAWFDEGSHAVRFTIGGVRVRSINYGGPNSSGVWNAPWCGLPTPPNATKSGARPAFPVKFDPIIVWAFDACDETEQSRAEVRENAQRWLEILAPFNVEKAFITRLKTDAGLPASSTSFLDAVGQIENAIAITGLPGFIHASPALMPYAAMNQLLVKDTPTGMLKTPLGSTWVFGGGYGTVLGKEMIATSQPYGWRDSPGLTETMYEPHDSVTAYLNQFIAIAEQQFAVGYEQIISAVTATTP